MYGSLTNFAKGLKNVKKAVTWMGIAGGIGGVGDAWAVGYCG